MSEQEKHPNDVAITFQSISDRTTYGVTAPDGVTPLAMISGYDLQIVFNLEEINTLEDAEASANALADVFYQNLVDQLISENKSLTQPEKQP